MQYFFGGAANENYARFNGSKKIASEANYNVLPVSLEMLSDFTTLIETMRILEKCINPLLYVRIRPGKRDMGTIYVSWF